VIALGSGPACGPAILGTLGALLAVGAVPIRRIETSEPVVAITFDACATRRKGYSFDRPVFDILKAEQVPATVFVAGRWVESHPDVARELAADPLIEFGNHSWDHPHMTRLAARRMVQQIERTETALGTVGKHGVAFRPPFGDWNRNLLAAIGDRMPVVLWDVVSGDPSRKVTAREIVRVVLRKTRAGSIVIFHINGRETKTAAALPKILRALRARGLRFVHLSELLALHPIAEAPHARP